MITLRWIKRWNEVTGWWFCLSTWWICNERSWTYLRCLEQGHKTLILILRWNKVGGILSILSGFRNCTENFFRRNNIVSSSRISSKFEAWRISILFIVCINCVFWFSTGSTKSCINRGLERSECCLSGNLPWCSVLERIFCHNCN